MSTDVTALSDAGESTFSWSDGTRHVFYADDRVDPELFGLATQSWGFLDESLNGLRLNEDKPEWASRMLMIYYASRVHGASAAATMAVAHRLGREAIILSRCQYEYFVKMLYYDHYHDEASTVLRLLESYTLRFAESLGFDVRQDQPEAVLAKLEQLSKAAYRGNFRAIIDSLKADRQFAQSAQGGNPFAVGFLKNADSMFKTHWTYGSSVLHAGAEDMVNVLVRRADSHWDINVDSRMKAPNKTICDITQRCFSASGLLRWRFDLGFDARHTQWAERFGVAADSHVAEPADIRSIHD